MSPRSTRRAVEQFVEGSAAFGRTDRKGGSGWQDKSRAAAGWLGVVIVQLSEPRPDRASGAQSEFSSRNNAPGAAPARAGCGLIP